MERIVLEFQAFLDDHHHYIIKELAIVSCYEENINTYFFKPPYNRDCLTEKTKEQNDWLERNYHRLLWEDGEIDYNHVNDIIRCSTKYYQHLFTKGYEKAKLLSSICQREVKNIDDYCVKKIDNGYPTCSRHNTKCALQNALNEKSVVNKILLDYHVYS